jgi:methyl-accepting chemotaxis protein
MSWLWLAALLTANLALLAPTLRWHRRAAAAEARCAAADDAVATWLATAGPDTLVTDEQLTVRRVGGEVAALLDPLASEIQRRAPGFRAAGLEGGSLASLHPAFESLRGSAEGCELTLDWDIARHACRVTPLRRAGGRCHGYLIAWRDLRAEQLRRQALDDASRLRACERAALEQVDAGLMLADAGLRIVALNGAMREALQRVDGDVTARLRSQGSDQALGAPLSIFDNGELRVDELALAGAAPRAALLALGGRRFEVLGSALHDADGRRVGAMLRWRDRTDALRLEAEIGQVVAEVNRCNLVPRVPIAPSASSLGTLAVGVNQVADTMAGIVSTVSTLARQVSDSAAHIAEGNAELGEQAERAARSLTGTAASTQQMSAAIRQTTGHAHVASGLAAAMRGAAVEGGEVVHEAREAMAQIERVSRRMASVVESIDGLAFATNLLALNAAIEAAHAGRHGGGFAVVAGEVRALAARSKAAAKEVHGLIDDSLRCVAAGSAKVAQSEQVLGRIIQSATGVDEIIAGIDAATVQQAAGIEQINRAVLELERFTRDHETLVTRTAAASEALAEQSADLAGLMRRYKLPADVPNAPRLRAKKREATRSAAPTATTAHAATPIRGAVVSTLRPSRSA